MPWCAAQLDLRLLREERERKPDDQRVAFYLAQTLHAIDMLPQAVDAYEDRVQMGGWYEEIFESLLRKVPPMPLPGGPSCCLSPLSSADARSEAPGTASSIAMMRSPASSAKVCQEMVLASVFLS